MLDYVAIEPFLEPAYTIEERCIRAASVDFKIDYFLIKSIRQKESGTLGQQVRNTNGTHDLGPMQINTDTIADFESFGITAHEVMNDTCLNIYVGTLHLWRKIRETGDLWRGVAWYHSKTKRYGTPYARDVMRIYRGMLDMFNRKIEKRVVAQNDVNSGRDWP